MIKVGQRVFLKPIGNAARRGGKEIKEETVSEVGRKYFKLSSKYYGRFHLESRIQDSAFTPDWVVYTSREELAQEIEKSELLANIKAFFNLPKKNLTLYELRKINDIINQK
jgi:hypothetical protein